ncbi:LRR receptor-like serine threonine-protein kinase [Seminavis robusta]|uniref:LRR receptor-like serine threonine-protein kinase n=1 Tax=Seminavis robusta TaxID=568900 RepID=A0A9N8H8M2_9STRA|nr:LRR receptor-like serine threonine-protein kinase [Seminavis robusta]|eukprot:Sro95_g049190.1 LRR receptor-like serine threonine-protein kinase (780) ;mRNA; r:23206-25888
MALTSHSPPRLSLQSLKHFTAEGGEEEVDVDDSLTRCTLVVVGLLLLLLLLLLVHSTDDDGNDDDTSTHRSGQAINHEQAQVDRAAKQEARRNSTNSYEETRVGLFLSPGPEDPNGLDLAATATTTATSTSTTERDVAGDKDEINPVLLRHLAATQQPGAFPSSTRPPNLSPNSTTRRLISHRLSAPPVLQPHTSSSLTQSPVAHTTTLLTTNAALSEAAPTLPMQEPEPQLVEASLVRNSSQAPDDVEQPPPRHHHHHQATLEASSDTSHQPHQPEEEDVMMIQAKSAGVRDYIRNPTFCLFLALYVIAILTIIGLVAGIVILQQQHHQQVQELQANQSPTVSPDSHTLNDQNVIVDAAGTIFQEYTSPQRNKAAYEAFQWLQRHPNLEYMEDFVRVQLYALATVFEALNGWDWPAFDRGYYMSHEKTECDWMEPFENIHWCDNTDDKNGRDLFWKKNDKADKAPSEPPLAPREQRVVRRLILTGDSEHNIPHVRGYLPPEVAFLTDLQAIQISYTELNADLSELLPTQLETLSLLTSLLYTYNQIRSTIPTRIARLQQLARLDLQWNNLSGSIPSEIGAMTLLTSLNLDRNRVQGNIPSELALLSSTMKHLYFQENQLEGTLPSELGEMTALQWLDIHSNYVQGSIPTVFGRMTSLDTFDAYQNRLDGPIPSELGNMSSVKTLNLWGNNLSGALPSELGFLAPTLEKLYLHDNPRLNGRIPSEFGLLTHLRELWIHSTDLTGAIPSALCKMPSLKRFEVNCLKVTCPGECVCRCYAF